MNRPVRTFANDKTGKREGIMEENNFRVTWWVGRQRWWQDWPTIEMATQKMVDLRDKGFTETSKAGVYTLYPPHRISRIQRRQLR